MYENAFNEKCSVCGGIIGYHINSYGRVVKQCNSCKHIIADDVVVTNKTTFTDYNQSTTTNTPLSNGLKKDVMLSKTQYCPRCGGVLVYDTDNENRLIKWCTCCKANWIIGKDIDTMNKLTETIQQDKNLSIHDVDPMYSIIAPPPPLTLEIKCDSITLKQNDISICFCSEKDIKQFDSITINGIKFKKVEEE